MPTDLRVPMTRTAFDAVPAEEFPLFDALLNKNPRLDVAAKAAERSWFDPAVQRQMTPGQRALLNLYMFGALVGNGGTFHFLECEPDLLPAVRIAAVLISDVELAEALTRLAADDDLYQHPHWFDDEFYDSAKPGEDGWPVVTRVGLGNRMREKLIAWVRAHPDEFIRPPDGGPG